MPPRARMQSRWISVIPGLILSISTRSTRNRYYYVQDNVTVTIPLVIKPEGNH